MLLAVLLFVVVAFTGYSASLAWGRDRWKTIDALKAIRWWMVPLCLAHLAVALLIALALWDLPVFSLGWYELVSGKPGNAILGQSEDDTTLARVLAVSLPMVFAAAVPAEARGEEELFRAGSQHRTRPRRLLIATGFGLAHLGIGVPIAAAVALIASGVFYEQVYLRRHQGHVAGTASTIEHVRNRDGDEKAAEFAALTDRVAQRDAIDTATATHCVSNWIVLLAFAISLTFQTFT